MISELGLKNVTIIQASFSEIAARPDRIGQFEIIAGQGVFTWVDSEVQDMILDIQAAYLAPDGLAYLGYNALPGWMAIEPFRELFRVLSQGKTGASRMNAIDAARIFMSGLAKSEADLMAANPVLSAWLGSKISRPPTLHTNFYRPQQVPYGITTSRAASVRATSAFSDQRV